MEDKSSTLTPSLSDSKISYGMYGRAREEVETVSATNVLQSNEALKLTTCLTIKSTYMST